MALWRARALSPEQKAEIAEEESDDKNQQILEDESSSIKSDDDSENRSLQSEESGSFLGLEDVSMSVVYSSVLSVPVSPNIIIVNSLVLIFILLTWVIFLCYFFWNFSRIL